MGKEKAGFLTPKAISNRIKAKGLQKLRWYCQMCQKQCRDENGFKCHTMSESHQRQLLLVADNPYKFVDTFSKDFSDDFLRLLRTRFGTKRVHCNMVYQEYIADRHHTHMNSTKWTSLTEYVKWLGRQSICIVDETEKGWFIQYIDRSPEAIMRQEREKMWEESEMKETKHEERRLRKLMEQSAKEYEKAKKLEEENPRSRELIRTDNDEKITFKIPAVPKTNKNTISIQENVLEAASQKKANELDKLETLSTISAASSSLSSSSSSSKGKRKLSALEEIREQEEKRRSKSKRTDYWIAEGIVVKVVGEKVGGEFYGEKVVIEEVIEKHEAVIRHIKTGKKIKVGQSDLKTVLPAYGREVLFVNGFYRGHTAVMKSIEETKFSCTVIINSGPYKGRTLSDVDYGDICKVYKESS